MSYTTTITGNTLAIDLTKVGAQGVAGATGAQGDTGAAGAAGLGLTWRDEWVTATAYSVNDAVRTGSNTYVCVVAHTSAALFATDLASVNWQIILSNQIRSDTTGVTGADVILNMMSLTTAEYAAITPEASTLYIITDA